MSEFLDIARSALEAEAQSLAGQLDRARRALAILDETDPVPLVRPPAPSVPDPPVQLPKRETREQRPAALAKGAKYDHAEVARVAREAHAEGLSITTAVRDHFGVPTDAAARVLITYVRREGHDVPRVRATGGGRPANPHPAPAAEPVDRTLRFGVEDARAAIAAIEGAPDEEDEEAVG